MSIGTEYYLHTLCKNQCSSLSMSTEYDLHAMESWENKLFYSVRILFLLFSCWSVFLDYIYLLQIYCKQFWLQLWLDAILFHATHTLYVMSVGCVCGHVLLSIPDSDYFDLLHCNKIVTLHNNLLGLNELNIIMIHKQLY